MSRASRAGKRASAATHVVQHVLEDVLLAAQLEQVAQRGVVLHQEAAGAAHGAERVAQRVGQELAARARQCHLVAVLGAHGAVGGAVRRHQRHVVRHAFRALQLDHARRCNATPSAGFAPLPRTRALAQ